MCDSFLDDSVIVDRAKRGMAICFRYLLTIRPYWSMADRFYFMARDLYGLRSKIAGKGGKFLGCPHAVQSQDDMLQAATDNKKAFDSVFNKKVQLPVQTDSGFVALWQMATLQQQSQDYQKRKDAGEQEDTATPDTFSSDQQQPASSSKMNNNYEATIPQSNGSNGQSIMPELPSSLKYIDPNLNQEVSVDTVTEYYSNRMASNPSEFTDTGLDIPGSDPSGFNFLFDGSLLNDMMFPVMWPGLDDNVMADIRLNTPNWTLDNSNLLSMPDERPFNVNQSNVANNVMQSTFDKVLMQGRDPGVPSQSLSTPP